MKMKMLEKAMKIVDKIDIELRKKEASKILKMRDSNEWGFGTEDGKIIVVFNIETKEQYIPKYNFEYTFKNNKYYIYI